MRGPSPFDVVGAGALEAAAGGKVRHEIATQLLHGHGAGCSRSREAAVMAELIPLHYRVRAATRQRTRAWVLWGFAAFALCGAALSTGYAWQLRSANTLEELAGSTRGRR